MPRFSNNFRRPRGKKARRTRRARRSRKVPNKNLSKHNVVTVDTNFDVRVPVAVYDVDQQAAKVYSPFYRFVVDGQWNDGIFWYYGNNYLEYPADSHNVQGDGRPSFSNMVIDGTKLYGGSRVVMSARVPLDSNTGGPDYFQSTSLDQGASRSAVNILNLKGVSHLRQISQSISLTEQMMYNIMDRDQITEDGAATAVIKSDYYSPVPSFRSTFNVLPGTTSLDGLNGAATVYSAYAKLCSFCVRNVCILLPADVGVDQEKVNNNDIFETPNTSPSYHKALWDVIQNDIFLKDDNVYGCPTGSQRDLYLKINPRYRVLRDFKQVHVSPDTVNGQLQSNVVRTSFYHRYRTDKPTPLKNFKSVHVSGNWSGTEAGTNDRTAIGGVSGTNVPYIDTTAGLPSPQVYFKTPLGEYGRVYGVDGHDGDDFYLQTGQTENNVLPRTSRIVWLRFPRFAHNFELFDVLSTDFSALGPLANPTTNTTVEKQLVSPANLRKMLESAYLKINGFARWRVLKPGAVGDWGSIEPLPIINGNTMGTAYPGQVPAADDEPMASAT